MEVTSLHLNADSERKTGEGLVHPRSFLSCFRQFHASIFIADRPANYGRLPQLSWVPRPSQLLMSHPQLALSLFACDHSPCFALWDGVFPRQSSSTKMICCSYLLLRIESSRQMPCCRSPKQESNYAKVSCWEALCEVVSVLWIDSSQALL